MKHQKGKNTKLIFFLLGFYILAQFSWWTDLLIRYNPSKTAMVLGEGVVFLVLLSLGIFQIYRSVQYEIALSRVQKNFLLSITHELKTPVAATKLFLQTLLRHEFDAEKRKEIVEKSLLESERLNLLIENLLLATSLDSNEFPLQFSRLDLSELLKNTVQKFKDTIGKDHFWKIDLAESVVLDFDQQAMASVVQNLLENAVKYSPKGSAVTISLSRRQGNVRISITDEGKGVPKGDEKKIFEKFFRSGNEETRTAKGTGLGLYIVKNLVNMHGGQVDYTARQPNGSEFTIIFPEK